MKLRRRYQQAAQQSRWMASCRLSFCYLLISISSASLAQQRVIEFEVPLTINQAFVGNITAQISTPTGNDQSDARVSIAPARLRSLAKAFANDDQFNAWFGVDYQIREDNQSEENISLAQLRETGLDIKFDHGLLTLAAKIPRLGTQNLSLRGNRKPAVEDHYQQSKFASGLNLVARNTYNHDPVNGARKGFGPTNIDVSGFTAIGGFNGVSLFYQGSYIEDNAREFARQNVVLVHDNYKQSLRYSLGDIRPSVSTFQTSPNLLGFSVERNYREINPFRNLSPSGRSTFTLDRPARVSFQVNGAIVETRFLEPGDYSIDDFPLAGGVNDVRILLDDGTSQQEIANFSNYVDIELLNPGITRFGLTTGVQREIGTGRLRRYSDEPVVLGFYERGISQRLTAGLQAEAAEGHTLLATNAVYGTRTGLIALETAVSKRDGHDTGFSSILRYDGSFRTASDWIIQNDIQASYTSDSFVSLTNLTPGFEERSLDARTSVRRGRLGFSVGLSLRDLGGEKTERYSATLQKSFDSFNLSLGYQYLRDNRSLDTSNHNVTLNITRPIGSSRLVGTYRSRDNEVGLEWANSGLQGVGGIQSRLSVIRDDVSSDLGVQAGYIGSRFETNVSHITSNSRLDPTFDSSLSELTLAGSVGFADGKVAFGRPFRKGFMIVSPHKNLRGKRVFVSRNNDEKVSSTKRLSTTLVPIDSSYRTQHYRFDVEDLPFGYDLGSGAVKLLPNHRAGFKFTLGSDAANTVIGKVLWPDETPIKLLGGKLISQETDDNVTIFTNKTGRFVAEQARFGNYLIVFTDADGNEYTSEIELEEADEPGLIQVGTIKVEKRQ